MPKKRPHEKPKSLDFGPFGPRNLKRVYQFVDFSPTVPADLREAGLGALLMLATVHASVKAQPPLEVLASIPANVPLLRSYLKRVHAKRHMYSDGAWRNMRSLIFKCMRAAGVKVRAGGRRVPLPPPWQRQLDELAPRQLMVLYPAFRWFVQEGFPEPASIVQEAFDRYEAFLNEFDGRENRREAFTAVVKAWETARTSVPGWPQKPIVLTSRRDTYVLPWSAFEASLYSEVQQLMAAAANPDVTVRGRRKRLGAVTTRYQTYQLRRIASALAHATGCDPKTITSVKQLVDPTAARNALRFLTARSHARQHARLQQDHFEKE